MNQLFSLPNPLFAKKFSGITPTTLPMLFILPAVIAFPWFKIVKALLYAGYWFVKMAT